MERVINIIFNVFWWIRHLCWIIVLTPAHLNISNRFTYITFATLTDTLKKFFSLVQRFILDPKQIFNFLRQAFNSDIKCIVGKLIKLFNKMFRWDFIFQTKRYLQKDNFLLFFKKPRWYDEITLVVLFNRVNRIKLSNHTVNKTFRVTCWFKLISNNCYLTCKIWWNLLKHVPLVGVSKSSNKYVSAGSAGDIILF